MHICLNYYGQPRDIETTKRIFNDYIKTTDDITYHILYTTWDVENTDAFKSIFPDAFIKQYSYPDNSIFTDITNKYEFCKLQPPHKTITHYLLGLYIKSMSAKTVSEYEELNDIHFDFIINLRTDTRFNCNISTFYNTICESINDNMVYTATEPKFACYSQYALPDVMFIANTFVSKKVLNQLSIIEHCAVKTTNFFHPESSFFNALQYLSLTIHELGFNAFPCTHLDYGII